MISVNEKMRKHDINKKIGHGIVLNIQVTFFIMQISAAYKNKTDKKEAYFMYDMKPYLKRIDEDN